MTTGEMWTGEKDWMMTFTGRKVFPLRVTENDVDVQDIAHSLAQQCRYNGHTGGFFSVAEHSVIISRALERDGQNKITQLTGLLHDAAETYTGDIIKPMKNSLKHELEKIGWGSWFKAVEVSIEKAISAKFDLPYPYPDIVHEYDRRIVADEKDCLFAGPGPWGYGEKGLGVRIECLMPPAAKSDFLRRFWELTR